MKNNSMVKINQIQINIAIVVLLLIISSVTIPSLPQSSLAENTSPRRVSLDSKPYGVSYPQWTAKWWQWALSIPLKDNPQNDPTGKNCGLKQSGPVWFLVGTTGGLAERQCNIPAGKAILFPIINAECSYKENPGLKTESELRNCAKSQVDQVTNLQVTVDGLSIQALKNYRIQSPIFDITFPENNIYGVSAGPSKGVSDGYWVFLEPFSAGKHEIDFSGAAVDYTATGTQNFVTTAKYHLTTTP